MDESHIKSALYEEYAKDPTNFCSIGQEISVAIPNCSFTGISKSHDGIHMDFKVEQNIGKEESGWGFIDDIIQSTFINFIKESKIPMNNKAICSSIRVTRMPGSFTVII